MWKAADQKRTVVIASLPGHSLASRHSEFIGDTIDPLGGTLWLDRDLREESMLAFTE
jgi:hypothetical protein